MQTYLTAIMKNTALGWDGPPRERKRAVILPRAENGAQSAPGGAEKRSASRYRKAACFARRVLSYLHGGPASGAP